MRKNYANFGEFCVELENIKENDYREKNAIIGTGLMILKKDLFPYYYYKADMNYDDAEDLCQTCLEKVFKCLDKFKDKYKSGGAEECMKYAYGIAGFTNKDYWRRRKVFIPCPEGDRERKGIKGFWGYRESPFSYYTGADGDGEERNIDDIKAFYPNSEYEDPVGERIEDMDTIISSYHTIIHEAFNCKKITDNNDKSVSIQLYIRVLYVISLINNFVLGDLKIEKKNYNRTPSNEYCVEDIIGKSYSEVRGYLKEAIYNKFPNCSLDWDYIFEGYDKEMFKKNLENEPFNIASKRTVNESYSRFNSKLPEMVYKTLRNKNMLIINQFS